MKKILVFIGSRANYSSIKSVLNEIKKSEKLKLFIILGSSGVITKYGNLERIITKDGFNINKKIFFLVEGENPLTMAKSTGLGLIEIASAFNEIKPDVVLTIGDRFETMASTLASAYMNIILAHTMGGEITGTIDESIRHATTKFAHLHFPASKDAYQRILKLGERKKNVHLVGCPRIDLIKQVLKKNNIQKMNKYLFKFGVGDYLNLNKPFVIISQHPVTTEYKSAEEQILNTLKAVNKIKTQVIVLWPNPDAGSALISKGIRKWREKYNNKNNKIHFFKNLEPEEYIQLMNKTSCLIGNSSSGIRDGAFIGTPVVNIGTRQAKRERAKNVIDSSNEVKDIFNKIKKQYGKKYKPSKIYGDGNAGKRIVKVLENLKDIKIQKSISY
tara:strand:+ start:2884 stop:4044 length:1161 start_codon:yes stop_codon:yes gene_type:complete